MKKILILCASLPLLISAAPKYSFHNNALNLDFDNTTIEHIKSGTMSKDLLSDANSPIATVDFVYDVMKLGVSAPFVEKHQTYHFAYHVKITLNGDAVYKNGLFDWFTEPSNALLYHEFHDYPEDDKDYTSAGLICSVSFPQSVGKSVFYNLIESEYKGDIVGRAWSERPLEGVSASYSGNFTSAYSSTYFFTRKYLDNRYLADKSLMVGLTEKDYDKFFQKISASYFKVTSDYDYSVHYTLKETPDFPEGVSDNELRVNNQTKEDVVFDFYDQFCFDSYLLNDDFEVNIKPSFTLRCGNNTSQALDPYEFYKFNETFNVKVNL